MPPILFRTLESLCIFIHATPTPAFSKSHHPPEIQPLQPHPWQLPWLPDQALFPSASLSQIRHFEEQPWGQLRNSPVFAMACQLLSPRLWHRL